MSVNPGPWLSRWLCYATEAAGTSHLASGAPGQDAAKVRAWPRGGVAVLSDGAGSAPLSHHGSEAVTAALRNWLPTHHRRLCALPMADAGAEVVLEAQRAVLERAVAMGVEARALACTLAFVSVDGDVALAGNLGDGVVGTLSSGGGRTLLGATRGEFANETVFVTARSAAAHLQLTQVATEGLDGFVLMSDGAAFSLVDQRTGRLARALGQVATWCEDYAPDDVTDSLATSLVPLVQSRTGDDVSVALLRRVRLDLEGLLARPRTLQQALLGVGNALGLRNRLRVLKASSASPEASPRAVGIELALSTRTVQAHAEALELLGALPGRAAEEGDGFAG